MKLQEIIKKFGDESGSLILHKLPQETLKLDKALNNIKENEIPSVHQIFIRGILF